MVCIVNVMHFNVESIGMVHMKQLMGSCWEAHINLLTDKFRGRVPGMLVSVTVQLMTYAYWGLELEGSFCPFLKDVTFPS